MIFIPEDLPINQNYQINSIFCQMNTSPDILQKINEIESSGKNFWEILGQGKNSELSNLDLDNLFDYLIKGPDQLLFCSKYSSLPLNPKYKSLIESSRIIQGPEGNFILNSRQ